MSGRRPAASPSPPAEPIHPPALPVPRAAVLGAAFALGLAVLLLAAPEARGQETCQNYLSAHVVALDQVYFWNRYGAVEPQGMIYALERDVIRNDDSLKEICERGSKLPLQAGNVRLRPDKRPRPLVLRMNVGDCLDLTFTNLLASSPVDPEQPATREASVHVMGMQYRNSSTDGGMWIGNDPSGLVGSGASTQYRIYAEKEGTFLMFSGGAQVGGQGDGGSISAGLFGAINVQPAGSRYFRSQVLEKELRFATSPLSSISPFPTIDYEAVYPNLTGDPSVCWRVGSPILEMTSGGEIIHSDLTAIITGPELFDFDNFEYPLDDPTYPHRNEPYREFTIIFHDEIGAVQAFPHFEDEILSHTLHSVRDAFAINYGTGGIGAEILANRLEVGPVHDCIDCKYEEFFLASWAVGDPAMVVDKPANFPCGQTSADWQKLREGDHGCLPLTKGPKATKAFYPDDPSNVYHSYMNDHVKFRNLHAGTDDHHIFHLHAHQWLHTPKSDDSSYMDSQAIGQGTSFTYEIAYEGSGNRNKTVGDSIFHCHFYPHFAQGMWALWRVHDVYEAGTELNGQGKPVHTRKVSEDGLTTTVTTTTRALPDGEIATGTPIPAIVPLPGKALPPPPTDVQLIDGQIDTPTVTAAAQTAYNNWNGGAGTGPPYFNPGYPFFIPGRAGHRAPHPPMDFADDGAGNLLDGGLPRHVVYNDDNEAWVSSETRLDFHKEVLKLKAFELPEGGTRLEELAMDTHALSGFATPSAGGPSATRPFALNGAAPQPGAPYADPCIENGVPIPDDRFRTYKAADIELDVVLNKAGWHFPQQRILALISDVPDTLAGTRPPEPLFFRANSRDCVHYELTNLVPFEYQVDDFQVRTPTDILGQHIHLVKFDVTSSDGGGNGFNYEDGSFSPEEVQERIEAIRRLNNCTSGSFLGSDPVTGRLRCPEAEIDPRFGAGPDRNCNDYPDYKGAQTTVQRWWADPVRNAAGKDRTLRTVFTHDHFGPSTHQQAGLYAGLVIEPEGSTWYHNELPLQLGTDPDGSPTSWQARIRTPDSADSYREFLLEFADFQLAYEDNEVWKSCPTLSPEGWADPAAAINPPGRKSEGPLALYKKPVECPTNDDDPDGSILGNFIPRAPCPEAVSADDPGFVSVNYRSEPLALRIGSDPASGTPSQVPGKPGDLSFAYESRTDRANPEFNKVPDQTLMYSNYPALTRGLRRGDPFTPVLRTYEGDPVQIRVLVGAHEEEHNFSIHGLEWLFEPFDPASGYRNSQMMTISEWFDFIVPPLPNPLSPDEEVDLLYKPSSAAEWQWSGAWGLIRIYEDANALRDADRDLPALESNPDGRAVSVVDKESFYLRVPRSEVEPRPTTDTTVSTEMVATGCPAQYGSLQPYDITAVAAREVLPQVPALGNVRTLVYNRRPDTVSWWDDDLGTYNGTRQGPLHDPTAILFVFTTDLDYSTGRPRLKAGAPVEPLILRAAAHDCLAVTLRNDLPPTNDPNAFAYDLPGWNGWHMIIEGFNANDVQPSREVALHPQLVDYDPTHSDGSNVGINPTFHGKQSVAPTESITYYWYAGDVRLVGGQAQSVPIEYGTTGLTSSDPLKHSNKGAVGALIIEPQGSSWTFPDTHPYLADASELAFPRLTRATADVRNALGQHLFREYVTIFQDDINFRYADRRNEPQPHLGGPLAVPYFDYVASLSYNEDPTESAQKGLNYRSEPLWYRMGHSPETPGSETRTLQFADVLTDAKVGGRPVTPIFKAEPADRFRFRVAHPAGHTQNHSFELQGHIWPELPYNADSTALAQRAESEYQGARHGVGASSHYDILPTTGAGGSFRVFAEYLYRDYVAWGFDNGIWGIFEVETGQP